MLKFLPFIPSRTSQILTHYSYITTYYSYLYSCKFIVLVIIMFAIRPEPKCSKFYLLFLPELPKILTHYSYFIPTSSPIIPTYSCNFIVSVIIMSTIHTVAIILVNRILPVQIFLQNLHEILLPSWTSSPSSSF